VHCSHCGFQNPATHRFCGMCGTPLSQQPIAAPAAHGVLSFTSSTLEVARKTASALSSQVPPRPAAVDKTPISQPTVPATPEATADAPTPASADLASGAFEPGQGMETEASNLPPAKNYFTDAQEAESLEQFIASFQYTPPSEVAEEFDMTGEKPVLDSSGDQQPPAPVGLSEEPAQVAEPPVSVEERVPTEAAPVESFSPEVPPPFATKSLRTKPAEPPRVLDLSVPPAPNAAPEGAPQAQGLSLLGLDTPPPAATSKAEEATPRGRRWVLWVAVIVILCVAALGFLEWRAEMYQINYGPVGILKTQINRLKARMNAAGTPAPSTQNAPGAAPASANPQPNSSGTEMQTAPTPNPQNSNLNNPAVPASKAANPGTANPSASVTH
jgi:hypothetical protein